MLSMRQDKWLPITLGIAAAILAIATAGGGLFFGYEAFLGDTLLSPVGTDGEVVIVTIDDDSIAEIGQWPWPRATYANLLEVLAKHPPLALGVDVLFAEESRLGKKDDEKLAKALGVAKFPVTLASRASDGVNILPIFTTSPNVNEGDASLVVDQDGVIRRARFANSFAESIYLSTLLSTGSSSKELVAGTTRIAWAGRPGTFRRVPIYRLLDNPDLAASLEGKIVLLGSTATDLHDEQRTAIDRSSAMPGVEIQANLVNMLVGGHSYSQFGAGARAFVILLLTILPALSFVLLPGLIWPVVASLVALILFLIVLTQSWDAGVALPIFYPVLGWFLSSLTQVLYRYFGSERSRREIRQLFGKYVSRDVLEELLKNPAQVKLGGEEREVTVLFSDVRGFTTLSESMTPSELTHFLNIYLSRMTDIVLEGKGVIDKYIGDAIMAFWGAPVITTSHAQDAALAAAAMIDTLATLNASNEAEGLPRIEIGIGLNTGKAVAGNMGSEQRFDYTLMGDTVNLSSRLESLTKYYGVGIIASYATILSLPAKELLNRGILLREIDQVKVKGKQEAVQIFEIIAPSRRDDMEKIMNWFDTARDFYYKGDWDKCLKMLADIEGIVPNDGPTKVLRERCLQFKVVPPADWNGVYEHKSK
jgi:adenylate cyclase